METPAHCFFRRADGLMRALQSTVSISEAASMTGTVADLTDVEHHDYESIWDTGATGTVISPKVVQECGLQPISMTRTSTTDGVRDARVFLVNLWLPNKLVLTNRPVIEARQILNGDVLIGMDVIGLGDFAVSNEGGRTAFTFRIPSLECIDFVKGQPDRSKPGRNQPCPCGSGKKYKQCHGK